MMSCNIENGILVLDKPKGMTSREACIRIKSILGAKKAGNSGTLDPNASGVLVICLGNATKIMPAIQGFDKQYLATVHFHKEVDQKIIEDVIKKYTGEIIQKPPVKSAVARKPRKRLVYSMEIIEKTGRDCVMRIKCQAGTYIRKLASDMGSEIGGAHLKDLRRTAAGDFTLAVSHTIEDVENHVKHSNVESLILPAEEGIKHLKKIRLEKNQVKSVLLGNAVKYDGFGIDGKEIKKGDTIALLSPEGELVAIGGYDKRRKIVFIDRVIKGI